MEFKCSTEEVYFDCFFDLSLTGYAFFYALFKVNASALLKA